MQNVLEYLKWRGDIPFSAFSYCEADYLVFAQFSYMPLSGIVSSVFRPERTLGEAAKEVLSLLSDNTEEKDAPILDLDENRVFLRRLIESPRFSELYVSGFAEIFDREAQEQFSAVSFTVPDPSAPGGYSLAVAFRGTDSTLIGWKEDFNMAFSDAIPSQLDAVKYLESAASAFPVGALYVCGHSKGGNLAVYASAFCARDVQDRIVAVRSLDGPGFLPEVVAREGFLRIKSRTVTVVPQSSMVGILLEHAEEFIIVRSYAAVKPYQHDPYTWMIDRCGYVTVESMTKSSKYLDEKLDRFVSDMTPEKRETLINALFEVVEQTGAKDVRELFSAKNLIIMLRALRKIDPEAIKLLLRLLHGTVSAPAGSISREIEF